MSAMSNTRLLLIRHAEVEEKHQRGFGGRIDMSLSARGQEQAALLARYLRDKPVDAVYTSPMKRVRQTLAHFTRNGAPPPVILDGLREVDFGDWTGHDWESIQEKFGCDACDWLDLLDRGQIPNAEPPHTYRARVEACARDIIARHPGLSVAVFCHGGVVRVLLSVLLELPLPKFAHFDVDYASLTEVELHRHRKPEVRLLNFTPWRDLPKRE